MADLLEQMDFSAPFQKEVGQRNQFFSVGSLDCFFVLREIYYQSSAQNIFVLLIITES